MSPNARQHVENACDFLEVPMLRMMAWSRWGQRGNSGQEAAEIFMD